MNQLIADNRVSTLRAYITEKLQSCFDAREASNLTSHLFEAYNGWSRSEVVMNAEKRMGESELLKYHFALKRLLQGEPLQYILGYTLFLDFKIEVTTDVLIPRPETEELVRLVVSRNTLPNPHILDIGTGSGCIAIGLKKLIPGALVSAADVSDKALQIAQSNAQLNQTAINFIALDFLQEQPEGKYDIVVSNPPYIPPAEADRMPKQVTQHEPHLALFAPENDALIFYRRLMELTPQLVQPGGSVFCEIHEDMANELLVLAQEYDIQSTEIHKDMQGKNRMLIWKNTH
jgi:release factor glutamine methyltransferase